MGLVSASMAGGVWLILWMSRASARATRGLRRSTVTPVRAFQRATDPGLGRGSPLVWRV